MMRTPLADRTAAMDDSTDDETLSLFAPKSSDTSSSEEEQEEDEEEDQEVVHEPGGPVQQRGQGIADLHSRHPWFQKWLKDGRNFADLRPEQYPTGYDPKRNESK